MQALDTLQSSDLREEVATIVDFNEDLMNDTVVTETRCDQLKAKASMLEAEVEMLRDALQQSQAAQEDAVAFRAIIARNTELENQLTMANVSRDEARADYTSIQQDMVLLQRRMQEHEDSTLQALSFCNEREKKLNAEIGRLTGQVNMYNIQYQGDRDALRKTPGSHLNPILVDSDEDLQPVDLAPRASPLMFHTPVDSEWDEYEDEDIHAQ